MSEKTYHISLTPRGSFIEVSASEARDIKTQCEAIEKQAEEEKMPEVRVGGVWVSKASPTFFCVNVTGKIGTDYRDVPPNWINSDHRSQAYLVPSHFYYLGDVFDLFQAGQIVVGLTEGQLEAAVKAIYLHTGNSQLWILLNNALSAYRQRKEK